MAEDPKAENAAAPQASSPSYPPFNFPILYCDGVLNATHAGGVTKLYLARNEPSLTSDSTSFFSPVCQIVMPTVGFIQSVLYLNKFLEAVAERVPGTKEVIAELKKQLEEQYASAN